MHPPERTPTRPLPRWVLLLCLLALAVPVGGALAIPHRLGEHGAMLWLLSVAPAFPLAYFRGLRGAGAALAAALGVLIATQGVAAALGLERPALVPAAALACAAIIAGVGWVTETLHRDSLAVEDLALTDNLTALPNRRHARAFLENEFAAAERGRFLSVVLFDLDHFKEYNDAHGHQAGDEALKLFASVLARTTRRMNLSARLGGEEFVSILAGTDVQGAYLFAERVRTALRARASGPAPLTVSAGVAEYRPDIHSADDLLAAADQALYQAKRDGRNCVRVARHPGFGLPPAPAPERPLHSRGPAPGPRRPTLPEGGAPVRAQPEQAPTRRVLLVEDDVQVRRLIATSLARDGFRVDEAGTALEGLAHLEAEFDVVLADVLLPGASGQRLVEAVKERWPATAVIVMSGLRDGHSASEAVRTGADRYLFKPFGMAELRGHLFEALLQREQLRTAGEEGPAGPPPPLGDPLQGARALLRAVERRDPYTAGHAGRVARFAEVLASELDPGGERLERGALRLACELHDLGKMGVPEGILNKPGRLTPEELREVHQHASLGRRMLEPFLDDPLVLAAARSHHESWDGSGYPDGLAGEEIPLVARVLAVAETLSALTQVRAYRGALAWEEALAAVRSLAGARLDPAVVAALDRCAARLLEVDRLSAPATAPPPPGPVLAGRPG